MHFARTPLTQMDGTKSRASLKLNHDYALNKTMQHRLLAVSYRAITIVGIYIYMHIAQHIKYIRRNASVKLVHSLKLQ